MGHFRKRIFDTPALPDKQFPSVLASAADLNAAGFFTWNGVDGYTTPITTHFDYFQNQIIPLVCGSPWAPGMAVISEFTPTWQAAFANTLEDRRDFLSQLVDLRAVGFNGGVALGIGGVMEAWSWSNGYLNWIDVEVNFTGVAYEWLYSFNGAPFVSFLTVTNFVDAYSNIIKMNMVRNGANQKDLQFTVYDSSVGAFVTSAVIPWAVAGIGDEIFCGGFQPNGTGSGLVSSFFTSVAICRNCIIKSSNIDHAAYALANPLFQM